MPFILFNLFFLQLNESLLQSSAECPDEKTEQGQKVDRECMRLLYCTRFISGGGCSSSQTKHSFRFDTMEWRASTIHTIPLFRIKLLKTYNQNCENRATLAQKPYDGDGVPFIFIH